MRMTFTAAMRHFFGYKPGQTLTEFGAELKASGDRSYWIAGLIANGYEIIEG